jgi:competence protein ComEC
VDTSSGRIPVVGGLRVGFTPVEGDLEPPAVQTGDEISVLSQAHLPQIYRDSGAFNRREFLAEQQINLIATLRSTKLLEIFSTPRPTIRVRLALFRVRLRQQLEDLFPASRHTAAVLRAMLLGDRTFVERTESVDFQKTGVFHVLVVAGLHVGALAFFLNWLFHRLRLPQLLSTFLLLTLLLGYVAVVEQRIPVLRAGLMVAIVVLGGFFYRRFDLLNSAGLAALILLVANPKALTDSGFQLSFLAIGCIAGLAVPWLDAHVRPYSQAHQAWRDRTRDISHEPALVQFRLDLRSACRWLTSRLAGKTQRWT